MTDPKADAESLLRDVFPFGNQMLERHGEFYPYGGFMRADGSIVHVGAKHPSTDRPPAASLLDILKEDLRHFSEKRRYQSSRACLQRLGSGPGEAQNRCDSGDTGTRRRLLRGRILPVQDRSGWSR